MRKELDTNRRDLERYIVPRDGVAVHTFRYSRVSQHRCLACVYKTVVDLRTGLGKGREDFTAVVMEGSVCTDRHNRLCYLCPFSLARSLHVCELIQPRSNVNEVAFVEHHREQRRCVHFYKSSFDLLRRGRVALARGHRRVGPRQLSEECVSVGWQRCRG